MHGTRHLQCLLFATFVQHVLENLVKHNRRHHWVIDVFDCRGKAGGLNAALISGSILIASCSPTAINRLRSPNVICPDVTPRSGVMTRSACVASAILS